MDINELLKIAIESEASDLHLKVGNFPVLRIHGELEPLTKYPKLTPGLTQKLVNQITNEYQREKIAQDLDLDLAYSLEGFGRFRGSIFQQRGSLAIALRIIPLEVMSIRDLFLPEILEKIALEQRGLVLITGSTALGIISLAAWLTKLPLLFPPLGPSAFIMNSFFNIVSPQSF